MWLYVISVVLFIGAIALYWTVGKNEAWANPVLAIMLIGSFVCAVLPQTNIRQALRVRRAHAKAQECYHVFLERLPEELREGDTVLFLVDPSMRIPGNTGMLEEAAGCSLNIEVISEPLVPQQDGIREWNAALEEYRDEEVALIIATVGDTALPVYAREEEEITYDLEDLSCFDWDDPPMFSAFVRGDYNPEELRDYIEEEKLAAVVVPGPEDERVVIGRDNIEDMPSGGR